ncbi:MAG: class I SAM-dependent RNA methyltransferase [Planctomycetes bacterium]|jgi:23S rRNA (uracil1939-C5)-methyltransferase|nr:class I SAM-dependent RNA methyltransferase [Planctomycetota bacterium]
MEVSGSDVPPQDEATLDLRIESLAFGGDGVARWSEPGGDGRSLVVFVPGTAPGDRVRAEFVELKKNFARAAVVEILEPSPQRRTPPCPVFGRCGGCTLQHLNYPAQLEAKQSFVLDSLRRLGGIDWKGPLRMHSGPELGTRTRARFAINAKSGAVGFRRAQTHAVEDLERCPVLAPALEEGLRALRAYVQRLAPGERRALPQEVAAAIDAQGCSFEPALGDLPGRVLEPEVRGMRFHVGPDEFFQGHAGLLPKLVEAVVQGLEGEEAWDLYAGVGIFARAMAPRFHRVFAVEENPIAFRHGIGAARAAGDSQVFFDRAAVGSWLSRRRSGRVDAVVLDPPRTGAKEAVEPLLEFRPREIRYVSCDPTTLARDLRGFLEGGYHLDRVEIFDLFPQTWHVETLAVLSR